MPRQAIFVTVEGFKMCGNPPRMGSPNGVLRCAFTEGRKMAKSLMNAGHFRIADDA
jgi:hypothetical protein